MQHILVCAQDSVLAKKVRFLLANDRCDVEILNGGDDGLDVRLGAADLDLLVLSRELAGEDAIDLLGRIKPTLSIPPTLVLGGDERVTADFIHLIPDPIDTQAIYRIASELLNGEVVDDTVDGEQTQMSLRRPRPSESKKIEFDTTDEHSLPGQSRPDELSFTDVTGLDEIAGRLDQLESDQLNDNLSDAFDIDEASGVAAPPSRRPPAAASPPPVLGGDLEPARFAKVLFQAWSKGVDGALVVARDDETSTIYLESGAPVHIESSIPGDLLGKALVDRGRITDAQYADGAKRAIERGTSLGQALVDLGFFSDPELAEELGNTAQDRIVACFAARRGTYEFDQSRRAPTEDRPYHLDVAHIIARGLRTHADEPVLNQIVGSIDDKYFKITKSAEALADIFPLDDKEIEFLAFSGRAYNVEDAAESSGLSIKEAKTLMALLTTCEEVQDFTPGVREFEARIRDEKKVLTELRSSLPSSAPSSPPLSPSHDSYGAGASPPLRREAHADEPDPDATIAGMPPYGSAPPPPMPPKRSSAPPWGAAADHGPQDSAPHPPTPPPPPTASIPPPPGPPAHTPPPMSPPPMPPADSQSAPPPAPPGDEIPLMPVPPDGQGMTPRPLVYAKPLQRGPDGQPIETSERTLSREHFQRGVTLLGQGNFANAEEAFRDAVALCSEEHVYLIGLARAIYYNPGYAASGKVPVLRGIVDRASQLAPADKRVATLEGWVTHAEQQL